MDWKQFFFGDRKRATRTAIGAFLLLMIISPEFRDAMIQVLVSIIGFVALLYICKHAYSSMLGPLKPGKKKH